MSGQFTLVRERRSAMYARVYPFLNSPPTGPFVLLQPQKEHQLLFSLLFLAKTKMCAECLILLSKLECSFFIYLNKKLTLIFAQKMCRSEPGSRLRVMPCCIATRARTESCIYRMQEYGQNLNKKLPINMKQNECM